jgi:PAS domain S-box-containing protein
MGIGEAAFYALADSLDDCVFITDRHGCYLAVNRAFACWVGRPADEIVGRTAFDLWPQRCAEIDFRDGQCALDGERDEREEQRPRGAETRTVRTTRAPVHDECGAVRGVLGVFRDVTAAHRAEHAAGRQAMQMELMGRLAGGVAHDFNNLLTAVLGHLALLRNSAAHGGNPEELLDAAERAAAQAVGLVQQLLAFLRNEPQGPEPVDLNDVVGQIISLLRRTIDRRIQLHVHLHPSLPPVEAVASQLSQLLLNLCLNARDAMPRGGRLWVETGTDIFDADRARQHPLRRTGSFVRLRVADSGEGMPPAVRARLFEPSFTTKRPGHGNGLGLTIVQSVVREHHGWIEVVSTVGQGTCFDVYLPVAEQQDKDSG